MSIAPLDLTQPHDNCVRCGRPTPLGVALCERDNPGAIKGPSSTQVHGTILIGVIGGFVALLLLLRLASTGVGPFSSSLSGVATRADGGLNVAVSVANSGTRAVGASCRITLPGVSQFNEFVFFTEPIPAGQMRTFEQTLPALPNGAALPLSGLVVRCN